MSFVRSLASAGLTIVVLAAAPHPLHAQANPLARLMGRWAMDSTNGVDDHGLPKSETLVFAAQPTGFRITATEDDGQGPVTSTFDCAPGGGTTQLGPTEVMLCTIRVVGDSVLYTVDDLKNGQSASTERGRLVVGGSNRTLRDEYEASLGSHKATRHRHVYERQG